jgi:hypothetical protein
MSTRNKFFYIFLISLGLLSIASVNGDFKPEYIAVIGLEIVFWAIVLKIAFLIYDKTNVKKTHHFGKFLSEKDPRA